MPSPHGPPFMPKGSVGQPSASRYGLGSAVGLRDGVCWPCAATANMATAPAMSTKPARPARGILALPADNEDSVLIGITEFKPAIAQARKAQARWRQATATGQPGRPARSLHRTETQRLIFQVRVNGRTGRRA